MKDKARLGLSSCPSWTILLLLTVSFASAQSIDVTPYVLPVNPANRGAEIAEIHPAFDQDPEAADFGGKHIPALWRSNGLVTGLMGILRFGPAVPAFLCWTRDGKEACPPVAPLAGAKPAQMTRMQSDAITVVYTPFEGVEVEQTMMAVNAHLFRSRARLRGGQHKGVAARLVGGIIEETETGRIQPESLAALARQPAREAEHQGVHYVWRMWPEGVPAGEVEFALAFGPDREAAARLAEEARKVSFDRLLAERQRQSERFYAAVPKFDFHDPQWNLFHRILWERLRGLAENAAGNIPHPYFMGTSAPWGIDGLWLWDAAFQSQVLHYANPVWAQQLIEAVLAQQREDGPQAGMVPHWSTPHSRTEISQPPLLSWAAWRLYTFHGDREFLFRVYPKLAKLHRWFERERTRADGLPFWKQPDESGMDNSPAFDDGTDAHVDLVAELFADAGMLAQIAAAIGREDHERAWREQEQEWRERMGRFWDNDAGFYFPMKGEGRVPVFAIQGLFPLWDPDLPPTRRSALLARLRNPAEFWAPYPVPSVSLRAPQFMTPKWFANTYGSPETGRREAEKLEDYTSVYWRGPVWVFSNAILYEALRRSSVFDVANELGARMVKMMFEAARYGGMLWENFDPRDGRPSRLLPKGQADEMAASIYFLKVLYDSQVGLEPVEAAQPDLLRLRYTAAPKANAGNLRFGPWIVGQKVTGGEVQLLIERRPQPAAVLEVENQTGKPLRVKLGRQVKELQPGEKVAERAPR